MYERRQRRIPSKRATGADASGRSKVFAMPARTALRKPQTRARVILVILCLCFIAVAAKLILLASTERAHYAQMLVRNWSGARTVYAKRGSVESRNRVALVFDQMVARVVFEPQYSEGPYMSVCRVAEALNKDYAALWQKALAELDKTHATPPNAVLADNLPAETGLRIQQMRISGITVQFHYITVSPYGARMASHTIGSVGTVGREPKGLEKGYDDALRGSDGRLKGDVDSYRSFLPGSAYVPAESEPRDGKNVVTTINEDVQNVVETEIDRAFEETNADWATVVVQNVHTGEIWAAASRPAFDPNAYSKHEPSGWRPDPLVASGIEPGSVIKPLIVAGLLDGGYVSPSYQAYCGSEIALPDGKRIREAHDSTAYGTLGLEEIIVRSSNIGMAQVARLVGQRKMEEALSLYSFFKLTGLGLPDEVRGTYPAYYTYDTRLRRIRNAKWPLSSLMNAGFGQGFTVTPIQLSTAYCTLANMGRRVTPKLVLELKDPEVSVPFPVKDDAKPASLAGGGDRAQPAPVPTQQPREGLFDKLVDLLLRRKSAVADAPRAEYARASKWEPLVKRLDPSRSTEVHIVNVAAAREQARNDEDAVQVLKPETCRRVLKWMEHVVDSERGTGKAARMESYRVAGKTGTAQIGTGKGGYQQGVYTASFVGILPAEAPEFVILVVISHPRGGKYYGGQIAAPVFKRIADRIVCMLKIPQSLTHSQDAKPVLAKRVKTGASSVMTERRPADVKEAPVSPRKPLVRATFKPAAVAVGRPKRSKK